MSRIHYLRAAASFSVMALAATAALIAAPQIPAAASAKPPTETSYYVTTTTNSTLQNLGCNQAKADNKNGRASKIILDFGGQTGDSNGSTLDLPLINKDVAYTTVQVLAEYWVLGYGSCTNHVQWTQLAVGTNNSLKVNSTTGGFFATWVVDPVVHYANSWNSRVVVEGADDVEPLFGSASNAISWVDAFLTNGSSDFYTNFGSADGCPPAGSCLNSWTQHDIYVVSMYYTHEYFAPEIYFNPPPGSPINTEQWAAINKSQAGGSMLPDGPLDTYPRNHSSNTAAQAWSEFDPSFPKSGHSMEIIATP